MNNNICALTLAEYALREKITGKPINKDECFTAQLIEPIYDFKMNNKEFSVLIYVVAISLWLCSVYKIYSKFNTGELKKFEDLFCKKV